MTETQERFLRAVLTRVPLDAVVELHLFPPIRRGTLETGVAVIAIEPPPVALAVVADAVDAHTALTDVVDDRVEHDDVGEPASDVDADETDATSDGDVMANVSDAAASAEAADDDDESAAIALRDADDELTMDDGGAMPDTTAPHRLRILTASYRSTIKGPDRGKWSFDVQEEADAPLEAVEAVLRGVRHRSTEPADPELVSLEALAALIAPVAVAPAA
jgi:hypothetical protein